MPIMGTCNVCGNETSDYECTVCMRIEIERLRACHEAELGVCEQYCDVVRQLQARLAAAMKFLANSQEIEWGYSSERDVKGYFLRGKFVGLTLEDMIAAEAEGDE